LFCKFFKNFSSFLGVDERIKFVVKNLRFPFSFDKYRMNDSTLLFENDEQIVGGSFDLFGRIKSLFTSPIRLNYHQVIEIS
jgi:hypothetical protein